MPLDRRARQAFAAYAARYDVDDPKVKLKIDHTYRVAALCERIAASLDLPPARAGPGLAVRAFARHRPL